MNKQDKRLVEDAAICLLAPIVQNLIYFLDPKIAIFTLLVAAGIAGISFIDFFLACKNRSFPSLRRQKRGIIYTWIVAIITIGFGAFMWFVVSYPLFMVIDIYQGIFDLPPEAEPIVTLVIRVLAWFLATLVFGVIIWALVSSFRREEQQYPVGM